ncbi:MAG: Crp/Fnr family transcriptional regulator [Desulfobacterales bacterium]|nr:Crp/Fnr family transcriptional regulator [Desulfobacterales bacterium]
MDFFSSIPLFEGLAPSDLNALKAISVVKKYSKDEIIFSEGDPGNGFYVVKSGTVKIFKSSLDGKEKILHIFGAGEPFGEVPVFAGNPFPAHAHAIAASSLLFFPRNDFVRLITENPSLGLNMLAVLAMRLRQFAMQIEHLSLKEVPARLASYLLYLSEEQKHPQKVTLSISKGQLASLLGTMPETLSRILARMSKADLIEVSGRRIGLRSPEGLQFLSDGAMTLE